MKSFIQVITFCTSLMIALVAYSGEDALYATPPAGSAFVRVFNIQATKPVSSVTLDKADIGQIAPTTSSNFVFVDSKINSISIDQHKFPVALEEGKFFTLVFDGNTLKSITTESLTDKRKGLIHLINLTPTSLDLKTTKGDVAVIPNISSYASGARAINPVKIAFGVYSGEKKLIETPEIFLDRAASGSLFVFNQGEIIKTFFAEDVLASEK